jgi:hypothetical protein
MSENTKNETSSEENMNSVNNMNSIIGILGKACYLMLQDREGVIIETEEGVTNPFGGSNRVILYKVGDEIMFDDYGGDLPNGSFVYLDESPESEEGIDEMEIDHPEEQ